MQQENFLPAATLAKIRTSTVQDLISCMTAALGHSSTLSPSEASPFTPLPQPKILLFINCLENWYPISPTGFINKCVCLIWYWICNIFQPEAVNKMMQKAITSRFRQNVIDRWKIAPIFACRIKNSAGTKWKLLPISINNFFSFNDRTQVRFLGNHPPQGQLKYGLSAQTVLFFLFQFRNNKIVQVCPALHPGESKSVEIKWGQIPASRTTTSGLTSTGQHSNTHEQLIMLDFFIHISTAFS